MCVSAYICNKLVQVQIVAEEKLQHFKLNLIYCSNLSTIIEHYIININYDQFNIQHSQ